MKKSIVLVICLLVFGALGVSFAGDHNNCVVNKVGVYPALEDSSVSRSGYPIFITCPGFSHSVMFYLSSDMGEAGLATALTAIALQQSVWVRTTTDSAGGLVTVMYLEALSN